MSQITVGPSVECQRILLSSHELYRSKFEEFNVFRGGWGKTTVNVSTNSQGVMKLMLIVLIIFQHIVFALKFLIAYLIPDVPRDVRLSIRRVSHKIY